MDMSAKKYAESVPWGQRPIVNLYLSMVGLVNLEFQNWLPKPFPTTPLHQNIGLRLLPCRCESNDSDLPRKEKKSLSLVCRPLSFSEIMKANQDYNIIGIESSESPSGLSDSTVDTLGFGVMISKWMSVRKNALTWIFIDEKLVNSQGKGSKLQRSLQ